MTTGGMPDMAALLAQATQMQEQMLAAQAELEQAQVQGTAGGGLVTATVTGAGELVALTISPEAVDPADTETLADLVVAAVRDANRAAGEIQQQAMGAVTGGMGGLGAGGLPPGLGF